MTTPTTQDEYIPARELTGYRKDLAQSLARIKNKRALIDKRWAYYDGDHPNLWYTERLRRIFGREFAGSMPVNYCAVVVDAVVHRLEVTGWRAREAQGDPTVDDAAATDTGDSADSPADPVVQAAEAAWLANDLDLEQDEVYRHAQTSGEGYVIVWPRTDAQGQQLTGDAGEPLFDIAVQDERLCDLVYGVSRRERVRAAKVWRDTDERCWRATLYYPDEVIRLRTASAQVGADGYPATVDRFYLDPDDPGGVNPLGKVPMVRFAVDKTGRSRLTGLIPLQDKINRLSANKIVAAEYLAWPQRWILTAQEIPDDILKGAPGTMLRFDPGGDTDDGNIPRTQVGQFDPADLEGYDKAIDAEVDRLFTLAPLPRHMRVNPGTAPSGEAVRADEGPFVAVVADAAAGYGAAWADVQGLMGFDVEAVWAPIEQSNDEAIARAILAYTQAGIPVDLAVKHVADWDADDIAELTAAVAARQAQEAAAAQASMAAFNAGMNLAPAADTGQ